MRSNRLAIALVALLAACSSGSVSTTEALTATTSTQATTADSTTTTTSDTSPVPPLIAAGCALFDSAALTELSPIDSPLALLENTSNADRLVCNFVGVSAGLDTGVRLQVERVVDKPDGHYTTAGEFESGLELAGKPGVGSGRGDVRLLLDEDTGLTLAVTIRSLSSAASVPRDGEFLEIRDAIARYLVRELG